MMIKLACSHLWILFPLCITWKKKSRKIREKKSKSWLFGMSLLPLWFHNFEVKPEVNHVKGLWKLQVQTEDNSSDLGTEENKSSQAFCKLYISPEVCWGQRQTRYDRYVIDLGHPTTNGGDHLMWADIILYYLLEVSKAFRGLLPAITNPKISI